MSSPPPEAKPVRRRHRSQQRDEILAWLRNSDQHPTAAQIHTALGAELPNLSLGTVYRNLEVLVAEGEIDEVPVASGPTRYDANLEPHHHFCCEPCGQILDVQIPVPRGLARRLSREHGLSVRRISISFRGLCRDCERKTTKEGAGSLSA